MQKIVFFIFFIFCSSLYSQERLLLIPVDETEETGVIIENVSFDEASREKFISIEKELQDRDIEEMLEQDFAVDEYHNYVRDHLTIEGQITAFVMALGARGAVGHRFLGDHLEVGFDLGALLIMADKGKLSPELGAYVKARLNPKDSVTYYFKGRLYKAWGLADDIKTTVDYGFGAELRGGTFIELTVKHYTRDGKNDTFMPFLTFGHRFLGPKTTKKEDSYLF